MNAYLYFVSLTAALLHTSMVPKGMRLRRIQCTDNIQCTPSPAACPCRCQVSPLLAQEFPNTAGFPYLALAVSLLRCPAVMRLLTGHGDFCPVLEGLLARKSPSPKDLQVCDVTTGKNNFFCVIAASVFDVTVWCAVVPASAPAFPVHHFLIVAVAHADACHTHSALHA